MNDTHEGVVFLLEDSNGRIAMQMRDDMPYWGLFGGWMMHDETPEQAAIRELNEELSVLLPADKFQFKGTHHLSTRATAHVYHVGVTNELDLAVLNEGLDWRFMPVAEIFQLNVIPHHVMLLKHYYNT